MDISSMLASIKTGISEIDEDHVLLLECLSEAFTAIAQRSSPVHVPHILTNLKTICETHFAKEECIMRDIHFRDADTHIKLHRKEIAHIETMIESIQCNGPSKIEHSITALATWLHEHMRTSDMDLAAAVLQHRSRRGM